MAGKERKEEYEKASSKQGRGGQSQREKLTGLGEN